MPEPAFYAGSFIIAVNIIPVSYTHLDVYKRQMFCRCEGTLPAPESSHAIRVAMDEAIKCRETGEKKVIVFGLTGTGYFDLAAYQAYNQGTMVDYVPTDEDLEKGFATLPKVEY